MSGSKDDPETERPVLLGYFTTTPTPTTPLKHRPAASSGGSNGASSSPASRPEGPQPRRPDGRRPFLTLPLVCTFLSLFLRAVLLGNPPTSPVDGDTPSRSAAHPRRGAPVPWRNRIVGHADVDPRALIPHDENWRRHPAIQQRALMGALNEVGLVAGVTVNQTTGRLLDGHLRVELALTRGEASVPVTYVALSELEEAVVLATFDPLGAMAEADTERLAALLGGLQVEDAALRGMLAELGERNGILRLGLTDPDTVPPLPEPADVYVRPGDLWGLGNHWLLVGDSTDLGNVARLTGAVSGSLAECLWTDPRFWVEYSGKTAARPRIANDDPAGCDVVFAGTLRAAPLAPSARFYVAAPSGPVGLAFRLGLRDVGWHLHQELVWVKDTFMPGHCDYQMQHETILYGYVPGPGRPGRGRHAGSRWYGDHAQSSVLTFPKPAASREHPTAKPVGLVERCLANSTRPGDLVYDAFLGTGTTLLAAERLGRRCLALELDPRYAQVAIARWEQFTRSKAVRT